MRKYGYIMLLCLMSIVLSIKNSFASDTIKNKNNDSNITLHRDNANGFTHNKTQNNKSKIKFDRKNIRYGANIGLSLSRNYLVLGIGPQMGYQFNNYFMGGAGIKYYYTREKVSYNNESIVYKSNMLGGNIFVYAYPIQFIVFFVQPELNYLWSTEKNEHTGAVLKQNNLIPSVIVGGGLRLGNTHITLNYDLVQHANSPYPRGFYLGFSTFF